jgi:multidrug efflux system outer membrane protein
MSRLASARSAAPRVVAFGGGAAFVVVSILVTASAAGAQATTMRRVEFDEAVRLAIDRNPTVASVAAAIRRAEALVEQARALTMPSVTAGMTNLTLDSARGFSGGVTQPQNQFAFSATASMPLLAATRWSAIAQARDQVAVASRSLDEARQQVAVAAAQAYLAVIAQRRQVEIDQRALDSARAHFTYADQRLQGGAGSRVNQVRAAQAVATAEARLHTTTLLLGRAQETLGVLMADNGPVDAGGEPALAIPSGITEEQWRAARPDVQLQTAVIRAAERAIADTRKAWLPTASVAFDPQYVTPAGLFQPSRTWRLVVSVSQPILNFGLESERAVRRVTLDQATFARTAAEIRARSEIRLAQASVASYERARASAQQAATHANEVVRITTTAFEVGATTNLEVIDAQRSAQDAETAAAVAEDAARRARLELLIAAGQFPR